MVVEEAVNWAEDEYWTHRRLSPAQLLVHDIDLQGWRPDSERTHVGPLLEINETLISTLKPVLSARDQLAEQLCPEAWTANRQEQEGLKSLAREYGWLNCLRRSSPGSNSDERVRWIHISSKFTEYLQGCLLALSDWNEDPSSIITSLRQLEHYIHQNERFSKHGRYFSPFFTTLTNDKLPTEGARFLLSIPFLDWTTAGETPPLRFQIDRREDYQSSRSSSHLQRSVIQHFYRLEDTSDREQLQVFSKHKPWLTDRDLDLKVRRWYGQYPTALNVDELWILVIDSKHVVTFSSNQTWKARWPPLQLAYRIAEVSFRALRNRFFISSGDTDYSAYTHIIACLNGAVGMLHRSFWTDITLCLSDRYAGYLGHLQYRLHRSPSAKLVMDLLQIQEELNIIIQLMQQQIDLIIDLQSAWNQEAQQCSRTPSQASSFSHRPAKHAQASAYAARATFRQISSSTLIDPLSQLLENLQREFIDLCDLRDNSDRLVNRTIQLVNIRLEDHGKAVLVFTIVTIIFLPLSFVASYLGMNTYDIRNMRRNQNLFWIVAGSLTAGTVSLAMILAFYGGAMLEWFFNWRTNALTIKPHSTKVKRRGKIGTVKMGEPSGVALKNFEVLDGDARARPGLFSYFR